MAIGYRFLTGRNAYKVEKEGLGTTETYVVPIDLIVPRDGIVGTRNQFQAAVKEALDTAMDTLNSLETP